MKRISITSLLLLFLSGCTGVPAGVTTVDGFDLERYLGRWYEIARLDHRFERGMSHVTANYSLLPDGGVRVVNRGFDTEKQDWKEAEGKAYPVGEPTKGQLKVSFFGPFYGGYNIIELDSKGYSYSLVSGPNLSYLWILSRTPELPQDVLDQLLQKAQALGFDTDSLIYVDQTNHRVEKAKSGNS